jgi:hypothetical protein
MIRWEAFLRMLPERLSHQRQNSFLSRDNPPKNRIDPNICGSRLLNAEPLGRMGFDLE